jgi:hypothetical protein
LAGNANYRKGVRFERELIKHWTEVMEAEMAVRTAGSHGQFDVIVICKGHPTFIQAKVTESSATAKRLLAQFREAPPLTPSPHFHQSLVVKITGKGQESVTV